MIIDVGSGLEVRSVANPGMIIHHAEYRGHTLTVLENDRGGGLRIDKAWDPRGQEINPASLGKLYLRKEKLDLRPNCVNRWGYDHLGNSTEDITHYRNR